MTVDWDQFSEGDEVAVTIVGKIEKAAGVNGIPWCDTLRLPNGWGISGVTDGQLSNAVDAYRIEPDFKPGDMVRDKDGAIWQKQLSDPRGQWLLLFSPNGEPTAKHQAWFDKIKGTRVKVVDA